MFTHQDHPVAAAGRIYAVIHSPDSYLDSEPASSPDTKQASARGQVRRKRGKTICKKKKEAKRNRPHNNLSEEEVTELQRKIEKILFFFYIIIVSLLFLSAMMMLGQ